MDQTKKSPAQLDEQGFRLLRFLVSRLPKAKPNDPRTFVSYKEVHDALGLQQHGTTFGESLKQQGLASLAEWTAESGLPGITGLIVDKTNLMPGEGYFKLFGKNQDDFAWWLSEVEKSKSFLWEPYLQGANSEVDGEQNDHWSKEELRGAVVAYLEMQRLDRAGKPYVKKKYYDELAAKFGRTAKSFEYRMQNISYVLSLMGRDWLTGLKPAKNVGANVAGQIEKLIAAEEGAYGVPVVGFEIAVREDVKKKHLPLPKGSLNPGTTTSSVSQFVRDPVVKAWVLKHAKGVCECCTQPAPFSDSDGLPFLEVHHVRRLADMGSDTVENAVAVCPNCHRELHYGANSKNLVEKLYKAVSRLRRE